MAKSERMRLVGVANRAAKAAVPQSPPSVSPVSHPAHALPVFKHNTINNITSFIGPVTGASSSGVISGRNTHSNISNSSVPAREFDLFEVFCADNSSIGNIAPKFGINVCRLTLKTCNSSDKIGTRKALALIRANAGASMQSSLPCTPWSTWNQTKT